MLAVRMQRAQRVIVNTADEVDGHGWAGEGTLGLHSPRRRVRDPAVAPLLWGGCQITRNGTLISASFLCSPCFVPIRCPA